MAQELLSIEYVKEKTILNNNIDWNVLQPIIIMIQELKLRPLLGTDLYNLIITQSIPPASGLTADNKTLLDNYILPILHWYLVAECCLPLHVKFMNKGLMTRSGENSQPVSLDDLKFIEKRYSGIAENYGNEMIKFIQAYSDKYPAYYTNNTSDKTMPSQQPYNIGWHFPTMSGSVSEFDIAQEILLRKNNPQWPNH